MSGSDSGSTCKKSNKIGQLMHLNACFNDQNLLYLNFSTEKRLNNNFSNLGKIFSEQIETFASTQGGMVGGP